jgi:hypothetical protein
VVAWQAQGAFSTLSTPGALAPDRPQKAMVCPTAAKKQFAIEMFSDILESLWHAK